MRKNIFTRHFCQNNFANKQILLTMRIFIILILAFSLQCYSTNVYSQKAVVDINKSSMKVKELISKIESQTDYLFVYNKSNVDVDRIVRINGHNKSVANILDQAFNGTDIRYVLTGKNIVLTRHNAARTATVQQQNKIAVKGIVTDKNGEPIIGANVVEKGNPSNGCVTDINGRFALNVSPNAQLTVTFVGYQTMTLSLRGQDNLKIQLKEESVALDGVVVTAMGLKKKEASLSYSTQQVSGDELTRSKDPNMITALAGKTAGVQINKNSSGLGGSARVIIRGIRSATQNGNNQPLYVIDGVPMLNSTSEQASTAIGGTDDAGNRDSGDGISNLNPDDIESINILKGASASALYGSQAANGVILITTKTGKAGVQKVTFSSNLTVDHVISLPKFQNTYGMKDTQSWGEKGSLTDYDNPGKFFGNGVTAINSLSFTMGNDKMQTYFSYANTTAKGIVSQNKLHKHNLTFRETANFFNNKLKLDGNVNLMVQNIKDRPTSGGYYMNPLVGLYGFPRGTDMSPYRDNFEVYSVERNMNVQNWYTSTQDFEQNPYWITNRIQSKDKRTRALASLTASLKLTDWLTLQARGNADYTNDKFQQKMYASTAPALAGNNGRYIDVNHEEFLTYADFMAMFNHKFGDFALTGAVGTSINQTTVNSLRIDSKSASLYYPNVFTVANIKMTTSAAINESINQRRTLQSVFGTAQLGWKESLYLDVTARNDWSSTLAYTKSKNSGFFYPSIGLTWVLNKTLNMPSWIDFGKIRGSWSQVGNDIPLFVSNPVDLIGAGGKIQANDAAAFDDLKPELSTSIEFGTEWKFFNYRLDFDFTFYRTMTKNQLLRMPSSAGADYKYYYVNAGKIRNQGVEMTLGITPILNDVFRWKTAFNFSANSNKVVELHPDLKSFAYGDEGFSAGYMMRIVEGGSLGDIYGNKFVRDDKGAIKLDPENADKPLVTSGNNDKVGNSSPKALLGWGNTFTYKGLTLYFLIDSRFGGDVLSMTQAELDQRGVSKNSGDARDAGFVEVGGQKFSNPKAFYNRVGGRQCTTEYYMYSATNIRLRELSLSYSLPQSLLAKTGFIKGADISLIGRNLFFFHKKAPFDPDAVLSTGNSNQGIDVFGMPTTRNIGFNLKLTF